MIDIVDRLAFDATRCEVQFSKGVASNIEDGIAEIKKLRAERDELFIENGKIANTVGADNLRLRAALKEIQAYSVGDPKPRHTWYYDRAEQALNQQQASSPQDTKG